MAIIDNDKKADHPIAAKIPSGMWDATFNNELDENEINLAGKSFDQIQRGDLPENTEQALAILMIYFPQQPAQLIQFAKDTLGLSERIIYAISGGLGRIDILNNLKAQDPKLLKTISTELIKEAQEDLADVDDIEENEAQQMREDIMIFEEIFMDAQMESIRWFQTEIPEALQAVIAHYGRDFFVSIPRWAGTLNVMKFLANEVPEKIITAECLVFAVSSALENNQIEVEVLRWLLKQIDEELDQHNELEESFKELIVQARETVQDADKEKSPRSSSVSEFGIFAQSNKDDQQTHPYITAAVKI